MGCGNSKNQVGLTPDSKPTDSSTKKGKQTIRVSPASAHGTPNGTPKHKLSKRAQSWTGSQRSLIDQTSIRGSSASSKRTCDSGIDDDHYQYITEGSDGNLVKKVEDEFQEPNLGKFDYHEQS